MQLIGSFRKLTQRGDTIIEVLMVVVVISTVLAAGYGIAIRSLQSIQLEQERTFALKLAEGQLENLKAAAIKDPTVLSKPTTFCINNSSGAFTFPSIGGGSPHDDMTLDKFSDYGTGSGGCTKDPNGGSCTDYCYMYGIVPDVANSNYTASVRWNGPRGSRQQVQLAYRIYP